MATKLLGALEIKLQKLCAITWILSFSLNKTASSESCPPILRMILNSARINDIAEEAPTSCVSSTTLHA